MVNLSFLLNNSLLVSRGSYSIIFSSIVVVVVKLKSVYSQLRHNSACIHKTYMFGLAWIVAGSVNPGIDYRLSSTSVCFESLSCCLKSIPQTDCWDQAVWDKVIVCRRTSVLQKNDSSTGLMDSTHRHTHTRAHLCMHKHTYSRTHIMLIPHIH